VLGLVILPELLIAEAVVLAIILAPTDAALGQAVVSDKRLPQRIRQALNVESGLNDGICVPLLVIALAWADADTSALSASESVQVAAEAIGFGIVAGVVVGAAVAFALRVAVRGSWTGGGWEQVITFAAAIASYALADWWGGSGFIAAFVGGLVFGSLFKDHDEVTRFLEEAGGISNAITFIVIGAVLVFPLMDEVDLSVLAYVVASLTVVRMIPVAVSLIGSRARPPTVLFLGWFGPRGLASLVFVVAVIDREALPHTQLIVTAALATVLFSVVAHGVTALPLTARYAAWYSSRDVPPSMESVEVSDRRWRWQPRRV
jgi:NhaP-type Na+/H+ or K+/H+ antiporter